MKLTTSKILKKTRKLTKSGPNIIMIAGLGAAGGMWIPRHRTFKSEMRIWIELEDN